MLNRRNHLFLTGASGFVGSAVLKHVLENTDWLVTCPVSMRHHGDQARIMHLREVYRDRLDIVACDLAMPFSPTLFRRGDVDFIWNIASESHVDRSLADPTPFVRNNVETMLNVLQYARDVKPRIFLHMSTDEVFGPLYDGDQPHPEWAPIKPSNPYSASKAAQEALAFSYWRAYGVPVVITNTMNLIGPYQNSEKFVPMVIKAIHEGRPVTVHAQKDEEGEWVSGSRCWIGVDDFASAWLYLTRELVAGVESGTTSLTYYPYMPKELTRFNIVGEHATNLEIAEAIADIMGKPADIRLENFHTSRPGHDMHYGLDGTKMRAFGWAPRSSLRRTLTDLVEWYTSFHPDYLGLR